MDALNLGRWMARIEHRLEDLEAFKTELTYYGKRAMLLLALALIGVLTHLDTEQIASLLSWGARLASSIIG